MAVESKNILSCDLKIMKYILFAVNFLFFILGIGIIAAAGAVKAGVGARIEPFIPQGYDAAIFGLGGAIMVVAFAGCFGAWKESKLILGLYALLMFVIVAAQIGAGAAAYNFPPEKRVEYIRQVWDRIQDAEKAQVETYFECCGLTSPSDNPSSGCTASTTTGCLGAIQTAAESQLRNLATAAIAIGAVELVGLLFACCLIWRMRKANVMGDGGV